MIISWFAVLASTAVFCATSVELDPYIQKIKESQEAQSPESKNSYIDELKAENSSLNPTQTDSYIAQEQKKIGPGSDKSAIEAVRQGQSQIKITRPMDIHNAIGFRIGTSVSHDYKTEPDSELPFQSIYGSGWNPDLTIYYEFQPLHSEWAGNLGFAFSAGFSAFRGKGSFKFPLIHPGTGREFGTESGTKLNFFQVPVSLVGSYRFNLLKYLRPHIGIGPTLLGFLETRNDGGKSHRGMSPAFTVVGGVALLLDWISESAAWNYYADDGVKHFYLLIDYIRVTTLAGDVRLNTSGFFAGMAFEY